MVGVELIPSEVWAFILGYAGRFGTPILEFVTNRRALRLVCRSMAGGLEQWIRQGMEERVKKDGGLRLQVPGHTSPVLPLQKEALIALSREPKEFLWSVTRLPTAFLHDSRDRNWPLRLSRIAVDIVQGILLELKNVTRIDGPFLMNLQWPDTVIDLSQMTQLKVIGNDFIGAARDASPSIVRDVLLPKNLKVIGDGFMRFCRISRLDLSHTAVERIGSEFLYKACGPFFLSWLNPYPFNEVLLPPTLKVVGREFLAGNRMIGKVDLSGTVLESVGDFFLAYTDVKELLLPATLKSIGRGFLQWGGTKILDLSHTAIQDMGSDALFRGSVQELILPRTVEKIGDGFLKECRGGLKKVDLSRTKIVEVGHLSFERTSVDELILPATMRSCRSLHQSSPMKIDLSRVGPDFELCAFLSPDSEVELVLPNVGPLCRDWRKLFKDERGDKATVRFVSPPKDAEGDTDNAVGASNMDPSGRSLRKRQRSESNDDDS